MLTTSIRIIYPMLCESFDIFIVVFKYKLMKREKKKQYLIQ